MKELSIQEKAERYDKAIEIAKSKIKKDKDHILYEDDIIEIFSELKENETIRKALLEMVNDTKGDELWIDYNIHKEDAIAWLESINEETVNNVNKVKLKFKIGDWIIFNGITLYINEVVKGYYRTTSIDGIPYTYDWDIDNAAQLWTINDARWGDILASKDKRFILIFKHLDSNREFSSYYNNVLKINFGWSNKCFIPATKEQRNLLFQNMKEKGYKWNDNTKEVITLQNINKNYKSEYCYILSFGLSKIFEHCITEDEVEFTTEELLKKHGLNEDECSIMYSSDKLNLETLED